VSDPDDDHPGHWAGFESLYILDAAGQATGPVELAEWEAWMQANLSRAGEPPDTWRLRIGWYEHGDGTVVSTVFLAMDHRVGDGPAVLFETLVFADARTSLCLRSSTRAEAEACHRRAVAFVQAGSDEHE
jgi:hypothetical protein